MFLLAVDPLIVSHLCFSYSVCLFLCSSCKQFSISQTKNVLFTSSFIAVK